MKALKLAACARTLTAVSVLGALAIPGSAQAATSVSKPPPVPSVKSAPQDKEVFRGKSPKRLQPKLRLRGITVVDATASAGSTGGGEPSIAVDPRNPDRIAITRFGASTWNNNASLLFSTNGGQNWTNQNSIPPPPGISGTAGCPCDQTIDYGRDGRLYGTFLAFNSTAPNNVVTGSTTDPTDAGAWHWNGDPAQITNRDGTDPDQPWLVVNRDPSNAYQDDVYVGYDDFGADPVQTRVAVSLGSDPVNITRDNQAGTADPLATNPGLRLATDPRNGTVYALYEQSEGTTQPKRVTYKLNRSTDGGQTWTLNGDPDGLTVDTVNSDQAPGYKFGTVNALLGGVDHVAVDPRNGDVYVVYGQDVGGNNQIRIRRLTDNGSGGLSVGPAFNVSTSTNAALPSVAVLSDGTVGVLYDTFDGVTTQGGFPIFSAHLARSTDQGQTFTDNVLATFQSPVTDNGDPRQRILGDYQELVAVGTTFHGVFAGNLSGVPATNPPIDAIYFNATPGSLATKQAPHASSAKPSRPGRKATSPSKICSPKQGARLTPKPTGKATVKDGGKKPSPGRKENCLRPPTNPDSQLRPGALGKHPAGPVKKPSHPAKGARTTHGKPGAVPHVMK